MKIISDPQKIPRSRRMLVAFGVGGLEILKRVGHDGVDLAFCMGWQRPEGRAFIKTADEKERKAISQSIAVTAFIRVDSHGSSEPLMNLADGSAVRVEDYMRGELRQVGGLQNREAFIEDHIHVLAVMLESMRLRVMSGYPAFDQGMQIFGMDGKDGNRSNYKHNENHTDWYFAAVIAYDGLSTKYPATRFFAKILELFGRGFWAFDTSEGGATVSLHGPGLLHATPAAPKGASDKSRIAAAYFLDPE